MNIDAITWPDWLPRILLFRHACPRCNSVQFKKAEMRTYDGLLFPLALRPVRCMCCWRRFYWFALRDPE